MHRILVVDNDPDVLTLIKKNLSTNSHNFELVTYQNPAHLLAEFVPRNYSLVISALTMPAMHGHELRARLRMQDNGIPILFTGATLDIETCMLHDSDYATDYVSNIDSITRFNFYVRKNMRQELPNTLQQNDLQTGQLINMVMRNINAAGGFMWLDLLNSMTAPLDDSRSAIPRDLVTLINDSAGNLKILCTFLTFLSRLDTMEFETTPHSIQDFITKTQQILKNICGELCTIHERQWQLHFPETTSTGKLVIDMQFLDNILRELIINAIKYSPLGTPLLIQFAIIGQAGDLNFTITIRNTSRELVACDRKGDHIVGIPPEYSERVFDLFYTIEAYPNSLPQETWKDGSGLFICRKLLERQNAWLQTTSEFDYATTPPTPYTNFIITIPIIKEHTDAR